MATIFGSGQNDTLLGTAGNDIVIGDEGNDFAAMGAGDDVFVWNNGDGNDKIAGQSGFDTLSFNTGDFAESIQITAVGTLTRLQRNDGVVMDLNDVERIVLRVVGGGDIIAVDDLSATSAQVVVIDLAGTFGGTDGDGVTDLVARNATQANDAINVALVKGNVSITGLSAGVTISHADATDNLVLSGLGGNDIINASALAAGFIHLEVDGGKGNDRLTGSAGNDDLFGEDGNDIITGGRGNDYAELGVGNDLFAWSVGDGSDTIQGGDGIDTLLITGTQGNDTLSLFHNGLLFSNGEFTTDEVERVKVRTLAGVDSIVIQQMGMSDTLPFTDVTAIDIDLAAAVSGTLPDADADTVTVFGNGGKDVVDVSWSGDKIVTTGLAADLTIAHAGANDKLVIVCGTGDNILYAGDLPAGKISLQFQGAAGNDSIFGSAGSDWVNCSFGNDIAFLAAGNDTLIGGLGNDKGYLGAGNDVFQWFAGDGQDVVEGQAGFDILQFNGSVGNEVIFAEAVGGRVQVTRNSAAEMADLGGFEEIRIRGFAGSDTIAVSDLAGADIKQVFVDLAGAVAGKGDGEHDIANVSGTVGNDIVTVATSGGAVSITGLPALITVKNADAGDSLTIEGGEGNDTVNAVALAGGTMELTVRGDAGNDTIGGSAGNDTLEGGTGADLLRGGGGKDRMSGDDADDRLEGGAGDDILFGNAANDVLVGGLGNDLLIGGQGNDTITGGAGNDRLWYLTVLDGHDVFLDFDGNAVGGQDTLDLDSLFDNLGVTMLNRAGRTSIVDNGATVDVSVDADGNGSFELTVATLHTADTITAGQDVYLGT